MESFKGSRSTQAGRAARGGGRGEVRGRPPCRRDDGSSVERGSRSVPLRPPLGPEICREGGGGSGRPPDAGLEEQAWPVPSPTRPCRKCGDATWPSTLCPRATCVPVAGFKHLHTAEAGEHQPPRSNTVTKPLEDCALLRQEEFGARYLWGHKAGAKHLYLCFFDVGARARRVSRTAGPGGPPLPRLCSSPPHRLRP